MSEGWICPRCKRVNAPFTPYCDCQVNNRANYTAQRDCRNGYHHWVCCGVSTVGSTYRCKVCGETKTENYNVDKSNITISSQQNRNSKEGEIHNG